MLPPTLQRYYNKLSSSSRDRRRRVGSRKFLRDLLAAMRRRFLWKLRSARINPYVPVKEGSLASGQLRDSLRLKGTFDPTRYEATVYTIARHYDFIDTGESESAPSIDRGRIKRWVEARFKIPASTAPETIIEDPFNEGDDWETTYENFIEGLLYAVQRNLANNVYVGLQLSRVIGEAPLAPGGAEAFTGLLDWWVSFYTMAPAA